MLPTLNGDRRVSSKAEYPAGQRPEPARHGGAGEEQAALARAVIGGLVFGQNQVSDGEVLDQEQALDFYVNKLGLEKGSDVKQGPFRWLTVRVPGDVTEIFLEEPGPPLRT